jgi:hypothetical protein
VKSIINTPSDKNVDWDQVVKKEEARWINDAEIFKKSCN